MQEIWPKAMLGTLQDHSTTRGRRIALYPGAFRPPHAAHFIAVRHLLTLPQIDEVVVIISNRCRPIPGTTLALDPTIAQHIWSLYLRGIKKVRVEVASHTAVGHAFEYFDHAEVGDTLLFCLGEADIGQGDDRFRNLIEISTQTGIHASLIQAPTGSLPIRSTSLRAALIQGEKGHQEFIAALPDHLTDKQREEVWGVCQEGIREMSDVIKEKIHTFINRTSLGDMDELSLAGQKKLDQGFRVRLKDGRCLFIKYAGDALGTEKFGQGKSLKPRQRLSVERKALKWLKVHIRDDIEIPKVICFEKKTWTLALSEICPNGTSLQDHLEKGIFNPTIAGKASQFLAECHTISHPAPPLWGSAKADRQHWERMLALSTTGFIPEEFPQDLRCDLATLRLASGKAAEARFINLNFHPKNILIVQENLGVVDFELSASFGDPAFDLGSLLGHYVYWILASSTGSSCQKAIQSALHSYQHAVGHLWEQMDLRVVAFTGAQILNNLARKDFQLKRVATDILMRIATLLLAKVKLQHGNPEEILCETIHRESRANPRLTTGSKERLS